MDSGSSPVVASTAVIFAVEAATGKPVWTCPTGDRLNYTAPSVVDGASASVPAVARRNDGWVYALDATTGELRWRPSTAADRFAPAVAAGPVYAASYDARRLVALDAATGARWAVTRTDDSFAAMPGYVDGTVYVGTTDFDNGAGSLLAFDADTGNRVWETAGHGDGEAAPRPSTATSSSRAPARASGSPRTTGPPASPWLPGAARRSATARVAADG